MNVLENQGGGVADLEMFPKEAGDLDDEKKRICHETVRGQGGKSSRRLIRGKTVKLVFRRKEVQVAGA